MANIEAIAKKALETEIFAAAIYRHLADSYYDKTIRKAFNELMAMEKQHVNFWVEFLKRRGSAVKTLKESRFRLLLYRIMFRLVGRGLTLRMMETSENQAVELYSSVLEGRDLIEEERQGISRILEDELVHEKLFLQEETKFEGFIAYVKDAVLGMNDGLVGTLSVTTGLAAASGSPMIVAIGGLIVGIGGGLSMGISSYTSSNAQRQVQEGTLKRLVSASKFVAHVFRERVIGHLTNRGYSAKLAEDMADETARDHRLLSRFIANEEYGLHEDNLGNPFQASIYAGSASIAGATIPLLPYFFASSVTAALILSLVFAAVTLAITGFFVALLAYIPPGKKIAEMIVAGLGCAGVTYGIGWLASFLLGGRSS